MATDILGKVGQKVGQEIKAINDNVSEKYATKVSLGTLASSVGSIDFSPYALGTELATTNDNVSINATAIATNGDAITSLQNSRATTTSVNNILSGTTTATHLRSNNATFGTLKVTGETTFVNSTTIEIADNIIELNLADDKGETAQSSGLDINRGDGEDKAKLLWQDATNLWEVKLGSAYANFKANDVTASTFSGQFKAADGSGILINNVSLGNFASFSNALVTAKTA